PLIRYGDTELTVFATTGDHQSVSLQKTRQGSTLVKINGDYCRRRSELARLIPCQIIYQDIFQIIDAGPLIRRQLMDWGLFHVKQEYLAIWTRFRQILKQR